MVKGRLSLALLVVLLAGLLPAVPVQASTWDRIGGYIRLLRKAGVKPLVAKDFPRPRTHPPTPLWGGRPRGLGGWPLRVSGA